jgi:hypothetical protein
VTLKKVSVGIEVNIVQEDLPDVIPPEELLREERTTFAHSEFFAFCPPAQ